MRRGLPASSTLPPGHGEDGNDPQDSNDPQASHDPAGTGEVMDSCGTDQSDEAAQTSPSDVNQQEQAWDEQQAWDQAIDSLTVNGGSDDYLTASEFTRLNPRPQLAEDHPVSDPATYALSPYEDVSQARFA